VQKAVYKEEINKYEMVFEQQHEDKPSLAFNALTRTLDHSNPASRDSVPIVHVFRNLRESM
jgi:hypothetical protein